MGCPIKQHTVCFVVCIAEALLSCKQSDLIWQEVKEFLQNQRPLFHCHTVGKWWGQSAPCRDKQSPVGLLILRQWFYVIFRQLSFWELQVGLFLLGQRFWLLILSWCSPRCWQAWRLKEQQVLFATFILAVNLSEAYFNVLL